MTRRRPITARDLPQVLLQRCQCGVRRRPEPQTQDMTCSLTCPRCARVASGFSWDDAVAAWNGQPLATPAPTRFVPTGTRLDFEADHPGPFDHICDAAGNELEDYANSRTQDDWMLWLRAQAAAEAAWRSGAAG